MSVVFTDGRCHLALGRNLERLASRAGDLDRQGGA